MYNYPIVFQSDDEIHFDIINRYTSLKYVPELFDMNFTDFLIDEISKNNKIEKPGNNRDNRILKFKLTDKFAFIDFLYWFDPDSNIIHILEHKYGKLKIGENLLFTGWEQYRTISKKYGRIERVETSNSSSSDRIFLPKAHECAVVIFINNDNPSLPILDDTHVETIKNLMDKIEFKKVESIVIYNPDKFIDFLQNYEYTKEEDPDIIHDLLSAFSYKFTENIYEHKRIQYRDLFLITEYQHSVYFNVYSNSVTNNDEQLFSGYFCQEDMSALVDNIYIIFRCSRNNPKFGNLQLNLLEYF